MPAVCTKQISSGGDLIVVEQGKLAGGAITQYMVSVVKPDGTAIDAIMENYSHNDQPIPTDPHPQRSTPPLSVDQLISLPLADGVTVAT